jgi:hypothetical protein
LAAAAATSLIAWLLTLLAMGIACKEIHTGGYRNKRLVSIYSLLSMLYVNILFLLFLCSFFYPYEALQSHDAEMPGCCVVWLQKTLETFMIILAFLELLYLLATHAAFSRVGLRELILLKLGFSNLDRRSDSDEW